jgi:hypothetical protein
VVLGEVLGVYVAVDGCRDEIENADEKMNEF